MSLLDKASLVVTPNAYKESKLYSVVPSDGSGDMTVVRATTATRINSAGLVEVVPRNLAEYSEQFDNASWVKNAATVTANVIASPFGIVTADKLVENSSNTLHYLNLPASSTPAGTNTLSVYAKADGRDWIWLYFFDGVLGSLTGYFNISNGTLGTIQSGLTASITSVGNSWYRCSITRTQTNAGNGGFGLGTANNVQSYLGNGTSGVYIWGAQLEQGSILTEYFPTTTRLNIPRIDYTNGSCPSLLVEPQRTNLILYSEQFDNADWMKISATITANTTTSPSGVSNADTLVITSGGYLLKQILSFSAVTGQKVTASIFVKNQTTDFLQFGGATPAGTDVYSIENYGNGWYRHKVTRTFTVTAVATVQFIIYDRVGTHFIWGGQVEVGAYATSYIPTIASSVTRNADVISKSGISSLIGQTEGTIFVDIYIRDRNNQISASIQRDGAVNAIYISQQNSKANFIVRASNSSKLSYSNEAFLIGRNKAAITYNINGTFKVFLNGVKLTQTSISSFTFSSALSSLQLNDDDYYSLSNTSYNNSTQLYKTALSDTECIQLTTL